MTREGIIRDLKMRIRFAGSTGVAPVPVETAKEAVELLNGKPTLFGRWRKVKAPGMTPGGCPVFECGACGGTQHLHGAEFGERKLACDCCGRINIYPWEKAIEQGSSLWRDDDDE